jgi:hypothetical protein
VPEEPSPQLRGRLLVEFHVELVRRCHGHGWDRNSGDKSWQASSRNAERIGRLTGQPCIRDRWGIPKPGPTVSQCAESAPDARERSMAECGATGASQEPRRCKHQSSSELAGGGATGIGHRQPCRHRQRRPPSRAASRPRSVFGEDRLVAAAPRGACWLSASSRVDAEVLGNAWVASAITKIGGSQRLERPGLQLPLRSGRAHKQQSAVAARTATTQKRRVTQRGADAEGAPRLGRLVSRSARRLAQSPYRRRSGGHDRSLQGPRA